MANDKKQLEEVTSPSQRGWIKRWAKEYLEAHKLCKSAKKDKDEARDKIIEALNDEVAEGQLDNIKFSSFKKKSKSTTFDEERMKDESPALYEQYLEAQEAIAQAKMVVDRAHKMYSVETVVERPLQVSITEVSS